MQVSSTLKELWDGCLKYYGSYGTSVWYTTGVMAWVLVYYKSYGTGI